MIDKNFFKLNDDKLKFLLKNKNNIAVVDKKVDEKIINKFKNQKFEKQEMENKEKKFYYKSSFAAVLIFLIFCSFIYVYFKNNAIAYTLDMNSIEVIKGANVICGEYFNNSNLGKKVKKNYTVKSDAESSIKLSFEKNININMSANSELTLHNILKNKKTFHAEFFLSKGEVMCDLKFPASGSSFAITTENAMFWVEGTKFNVKIMDNKDIKLDVMEGRVTAMNFIKIQDDLKTSANKYYDLFNRILAVETRTITIDKGQSIILKYELLEKINAAFNDLANSLNNYLKQNKLLTDENKSFYEKKINMLNNQVNEMQVISNYTFETEIKIEKNKEFIKTKKIKLLSMNNINLSELGTAVTNDSENIYVTSDKNKTVYCINPETGNLLWKFNNADITKLNSSAIPFNNDLFIPSIDKLFILDKKGNLLKTENLNNNPVFWSSSIIYQNSLLIPSLNSIYCYKNNELSVYDENINLNGQIYLSSYDNQLFINALNDKKLFVYDTFDKRLNAFSHKFKDRSFNAPVYYNGFIYISGINKTIYKYKNLDFTEEPEKASFDNGFASNLIFYNKNLYFIDDKGYFIKMNSINLKIMKKISHVENNPTIDKFLTKKLFYYNDFIYFTSDKAEIFCYDLINDNYQILKNDFKGVQFTANPAVCSSEIYVVDIKGNLFKIYN